MKCFILKTFAVHVLTLPKVKLFDFLFCKQRFSSHKNHFTSLGKDKQPENERQHCIFSQTKTCLVNQNEKFRGGGSILLHFIQKFPQAFFTSTSLPLSFAWFVPVWPQNHHRSFMARVHQSGPPLPPFELSRREEGSRWRCLA